MLERRAGGAWGVAGFLAWAAAAGCASSTSPPASASSPPPSASASSSPPSAPVAHAGPASGSSASEAPQSASASPSAPVPVVPPAAPKYSEEEQFWLDLSVVFNQELAVCLTGWTGDGRITVKGGKIARFELVEHGLKGDVATPVPALVGKKVPTVPSALRKVFDAPVHVSVCVGGTRIWQSGAP